MPFGTISAIPVWAGTHIGGCFPSLPGRRDDGSPPAPGLRVVSGRLPSSVLVSALLRRANDSGGIGMVLARGEPSGGAILVIALEQGGNPRTLERGIGPEGKVEIIVSPQPTGDPTEVTHYWQRRRRTDPDLWVIELDTPFAERFAAETICDS